MTETPPIELSDARCLGCGYALRGLVENRCPECGRPFDPADPLTFASEQFRQRLRVAFWLPGVLLCTTFVTVFVAPALLDMAGVRVLRVVGPWNERPVVGAWATIALVVSWWLRTRARRAIIWPIAEPQPRSERVARSITVVVIAALLIWTSGGIGTWTCPHGTSYRFSFVGMTRSAVGGPCRNYGRMWRVWRVSNEWYVWIGD